MQANGRSQVSAPAGLAVTGNLSSNAVDLVEGNGIVPGSLAGAAADNGLGVVDTAGTIDYSDGTVDSAGAATGAVTAKTFPAVEANENGTAFFKEFTPAPTSIQIKNLGGTKIGVIVEYSTDSGKTFTYTHSAGVDSAAVGPFGSATIKLSNKGGVCRVRAALAEDLQAVQAGNERNNANGVLEIDTHLDISANGGSR